MNTASGLNVANYQKLVKTIQELSLARDLSAIMEIVRNTARELTGADGCTFVLRQGDMCYYAEEDAIAPLWKGASFSQDICISGWVMRNKQMAVIEDIYADDRIPHDLYSPTFVKSLVMTPIRTIDPVGAIGCYWARNYKPAQEELDMIQSLADIIAVSMENIRINSELEQRVAERTSALEEVNKELELFSYSVSHDLRAPLRGINGFSTILLEEYGKNLDGEGRRIIEKVLGNVKKMNALIENLNDLFRTRKKELQRGDLQMTKLVTEIANELKEEEKNRKIFIEIHDLPDAQGDAILLRQVFLNLIGNAIKYSSKKPETHIEIGALLNVGKAVYYIKDNGAGFNMKYYDQLFGIFQRLHTQKEFEGTGMGLAIVQKIISRHHGKIWAESEVGKGTTFYLTLG